jgi:hypothetical protein
MPAEDIDGPATHAVICVICESNFTTSGFWYARGFEQIVSVSWYYPPEQWKQLEDWYNQTHNTFWRLFHQAGRKPLPEAMRL